MEVVERFPERLQVTCLTTGESVGLLAQQCQTYRPKIAVVASADAAQELQHALNGTSTRVLFGPQGLLEAAASDVYDIALMAIAGVAALQPTLEILKTGQRLALANKESLVAAGHLIMPEVEVMPPEGGRTSKTPKGRTPLTPVDSEHSALFQLLCHAKQQEVAGVTLTASGGPLLHATEEEFERVTPQMALRHPTWHMGPKVTVDSATLMNKGLEVIEARWLFALPPSQIHVLIHPQSIVHSLINLKDGTCLAQISLPDMRIPIQYALLGREPFPFPCLDLATCGPLTFEAPDPQRFPCLALAYQAAETGGTAPAVLNAADEEAVTLFLEGKIAFQDIAKVIEIALEKHTPVPCPSLEEVLAADAWARQVVRSQAPKSING
jgi:1-deoxy-D-xylulose-5-phosphate reductoisomerase